MPSPPAVRKLKKHRPQQPTKSGVATPKHSTNTPKKAQQTTPVKQQEQVRESLNSTSEAESPIAAEVEGVSASFGRGSGMGVFHATENPKAETPNTEYVEDSQGELHVHVLVPTILFSERFGIGNTIFLVSIFVPHSNVQCIKNFKCS